MNFHTTKNFIFQSYLVRMFLFFIEENLQFLEMLLTTEVNNSIFNYMKLIMEDIYRVILQTKIPRFFPEMEDMWQFYPNGKVGDWFLLNEHTIIRVYDFFHQPYMLPAFLTPIMFSLEFITKKLTVENEHFINFRKAYEIKFSLKVGPFIIKNKPAPCG